MSRDMNLLVEIGIFWAPWGCLLHYTVYDCGFSGVLAKFAKIVTFLLGENDDAAVKHGCGNTLGIKQETGFRWLLMFYKTIIPLVKIVIFDTP